jgi:uncharacterized protein YjbI with pentapeptide repeats
VINKADDKKYADLIRKLQIDCSKCSGLCCVALYCAKSDGFPDNKIAGKPCQNLMSDFCCAIHPQLMQANMKGCLAYDCFGAGQKVTQDCYPNTNWKKNPEKANEIFEVFLVMVQLYQMLWYLIEASHIISEKATQLEIEALILENEEMTARRPDEILRLDVETYRLKTNNVLKQVTETIATHSFTREQNKDFLGKDFKKANLDGKDFSMSLMIAANLSECSLSGTNFLGADMRDANIQDTDLGESIFLTQMQVNAAKGNANTKLPFYLARPISWQEL